MNFVVSTLINKKRIRLVPILKRTTQFMIELVFNWAQVHLILTERREVLQKSSAGWHIKAEPAIPKDVENACKNIKPANIASSTAQYLEHDKN
ncbi:hypothetical protein VNO77_43232 [Canavalia gladiata]|uniref:Uncharacterized protein n=1 Tax=Canavalia gladiata TaxID=3824 RepID=A0AAN9PPR9_CANGL